MGAVRGRNLRVLEKGLVIREKNVDVADVQVATHSMCRVLVSQDVAPRRLRLLKGRQDVAGVFVVYTGQLDRVFFFLSAA